MNIRVFSDNKVSRFAENELKSYLSRMGCPNLDYKLNVTDLSIYDLEKVSDNDLDVARVIHTINIALTRD